MMMSEQEGRVRHHPLPRYQYHTQNCYSTLYKPGPGLPLDVIKEVKPIFESLSQDNLLSKCLHGTTQNHNESFNGMIWKRIPTDTFVKMAQFEI